MDKIITLAFYRLERAKEDLLDAELLYANKRYKSANNRAYYSMFHTMRAVLALEQKDFKKHKTVVSYFNEHYVKTEIFPKILGKKIANATRTREDSDYDDEFIVSPENTVAQIQTARDVIDLIENYLKEKSG